MPDKHDRHWGSGSLVGPLEGLRRGDSHSQCIFSSCSLANLNYRFCPPVAGKALIFLGRADEVVHGRAGRGGDHFGHPQLVQVKALNSES